MSPEEMGETATPSNAAERLFGNTTDYDEEIEEMLMFNCLHGDYHDIDLHLYELHLNGDAQNAQGRRSTVNLPPWS